MPLKFSKWKENKIDWNLLTPVLREAFSCLPLHYVILPKNRGKIIFSFTLWVESWCGPVHSQ